MTNIENESTKESTQQTRNSWRSRFIVMTVLFGVVALVAVFAVTRLISTADHSEPVTGEEALEYVNNVIDVSLTDSPELVCLNSIFQNQCLSDFADNKASKPTTRSEAVCAWPINNSGGSQAVAVKGVDGEGESFISYLTVSREYGELIGGNNVYWYPYLAPAHDAKQVRDDGVVCE